MNQLHEAISSKNINACRSIIIASIRQEIISKSQFTKYLRECLNAFGKDFFDQDDGLIISNNKKDLFASIKVNFSQKKTNQLLAILPDISDENETQSNHKTSVNPRSNSSKKLLLMVSFIVIIILVSIFILRSSPKNIQENTPQQINHTKHKLINIQDKNHDEKTR